MTNEIKTLLEQEKQNKFTFADHNAFELVYQLLPDIGHPDPEIRDGLMYPALAHLLHDKHLNEEQLTAVLDKLIGPEYLMFDLENIVPNSVLIRSFTVLQLVILVYVHNRDQVIDPRYIDKLYNQFMLYFQQETILLGYEEHTGFLHAIAHSADLFAQLFQVKHFDETKFKAMFTLIQSKYKIDHYYYSHDEDERMINAVVKALETDKLDDVFLTNWVTQVATYTKPTDFPAAYYMKNNVRNFLRSLYFRLQKLEKYQPLRTHIEDILNTKVTLR